MLLSLKDSISLLVKWKSLLHLLHKMLQDFKRARWSRQNLAAYSSVDNKEMANSLLLLRGRTCFLYLWIQNGLCALLDIPMCWHWYSVNSKIRLQETIHLLPNQLEHVFSTSYLMSTTVEETWSSHMKKQHAERCLGFPDILSLMPVELEEL